MQSKRSIVTIVFCIAILFSLSFATQSGKMAPNFTARDIKGQMVKSEGIYNNAPTVIFFWHTCGCCGIKKEQHEAFNAAYTKYKEKGLNIIGVALDGKKKTAQVKKAVKVNKMEYISIVDDNNKIKNMYKPATLPATYLVAKGGKVLSVFNGFKPGDNGKIAKILELVFKRM